MKRSSLPSKRKVRLNRVFAPGSIAIGLALNVGLPAPLLALDTTFGAVAQVDDAVRPWWEKDHEARVALKAGDLEQAKSLFEEAIKIAEKNANIEPGVINSLLGLCLLEHKRGNNFESERLYELAMNYEQGLAGRGSMRFAALLIDGAWLFHWHGKDDKAELLYRECITIIEHNLPTDDPKLLPVLYHYKAFLKECGRVSESEKISAEITRIESKSNNQVR
jgi:hypothetical protein